jgi:hypothetical protein
MAQQQQTVLRVQNSRDVTPFIFPDALLTVATGTTMTISGSGTTLNPYSGSTTTGNRAYFDVIQNSGIVYFDITGMVDAGGFYDPANIYLIRNGVSYLVRRSTATILGITGQIDVLIGDQIYIDNSNPDTDIGINSLYIVTDNTNNIIYDTINLDLYGDIPIKINKSFAELQDISKRNSDFSIGLSLPGSKTNNAFFESFFDVDVDTLYFNPLLRTPATVLINDEVYFDGYLKLNKISVLNSKVEYDVTLFSNVSDLFGKIGNNLLKDLPYDNPIYNFNHNFDIFAILQSWDRRPGFNYDDNPKLYMYPITHNGYNYTGDTVNLSGGTVDEQTRLYTTSGPLGSWPNEAAMLAAGVQPYRINVTGSGIIDNQLKPALSVWGLIQLMFQTYGYTIKSDFMNTPWMKGLYMYGYFNSDRTKFYYKTPVPQTLTLDGVSVVLVETYIDSSEFPCGTQYFRTDRTYTIYVVKKNTGIPCLCSDQINLVLDYALFPCYGGPSQPYTVSLTIPPNTTGTTYSWVSNQYVDCGSGCPFQLEYTQNYGLNTTLSNVNASTTGLAYTPTAPNTDVLIEDDDYVNFNLIIDQNIKQIDFLASIAKKFNLVFIPDKDVKNQIIIEPYQYYVGTGSIYDWTDKLSWDKGFTVEPAQNFVESELILTDLEDGDDGNKQFKDRNNRIYGQNFVYNQTDFKSQTKKIDTINSAQVTRKWDDRVVIPLGINYASSNSPETSGSSERVKWTYKGVKTKPKLFYNLGSRNIFFGTNINQVFNTTYMWNTFLFNINRSDNVGAAQSFDVPVISNTMPLGNPDSNKINNDSICILFNSEQPTDVGVETFNGINAYTENDMYNLFYENRVDNLYDPNTRFLSGYFDLKLSDVRNLEARDIIKIKEQYFTWNKIDGYNMVNPELTKVQLVQIDNNPSTYPTRYFQYYYCADTGTTYNIKTDFTNPQMNLTHFFISNWYDYNVGLLGGSVSGITSAFKYSYGEYLPFTMYEVDKNTYDTTGLIYTDDPNSSWDSVSVINYAMPTYWEQFSGGTAYSGINLWTNCASFNNTATTYGLEVVMPSGGTPTSIYHSGITINVTDTGWIKYDTATETKYTYFGSLGNQDIPDCADCSTIRTAFPFADLATWTVIDCGSPCP